MLRGGMQIEESKSVDACRMLNALIDTGLNALSEKVVSEKTRAASRIYFYDWNNVLYTYLQKEFAESGLFNLIKIIIVALKY